jgi:hypothetical protein
MVRKDSEPIRGFERSGLGWPLCLHTRRYLSSGEDLANAFHIGGKGGKVKRVGVKGVRVMVRKDSEPIRGFERPGLGV